MRIIAPIAAILPAIIIMAVSTSAHAAPKPTTNNKIDEVNTTAKIVTVNSGDTLSKIAQVNETTWRRLYDDNNKIKNPNLIYPAEKLAVPTADQKLADRPLPTTANTELTQAPAPKVNETPAVNVHDPEVSAPVVSDESAGVWDELAACESGDNWAADTGNGFYGGLQFTLSSWHAVGGAGNPANAPKSEQIQRAELLKARQGWGAWPACSAELGLR